MSEGDPPNDGWEEILSQVNDALRIQGFGDLPEDQQQALREGLDEALGRLAHSSSPAVSANVTVVEGGRDEGAPPSGGKRPDLRVAPSPTAAADPDLEVVSRVRVVRLDELRRDLRPAAAQGQIRLDPEGAVRQTLFRGEVPRPYRLHCEVGKMRVSLDGQPAETLGAGQSLDVEARLIRVSADAPVRGTYLRL